MGMGEQELERALIVGAPPPDTSGRSRYGMGMKTAACWLGDLWIVRTKLLGSTTEITVAVDVESVAAGNNELPMEKRDDADPDNHYTIIEIRRLNRVLHGRTLGKIKDYLSSMYRQDIREGILTLVWQDDELSWHEPAGGFQRDPAGNEYRRNFAFDVDGKHIHGWAGVLDRGSRAKAGFSILHANRVVTGWPKPWRPETIYGQVEGSNNLLNQRLVGEIHLDDFEVTHTKDDILWVGTEQEEAEAALRQQISDLIDVASTPRRGRDLRRPAPSAVREALARFTREVGSPELEELIHPAPSEEATESTTLPFIEALSRSVRPSFTADFRELTISGYLTDELRDADPYVLEHALADGRLIIVINMSHPHLLQVPDSQTMLNYLRSSTFDVLAAREAATGNGSAHTFLGIKDQLLRAWLNIGFSQSPEGTAQQ